MVYNNKKNTKGDDVMSVKDTRIGFNLNEVEMKQLKRCKEVLGVDTMTGVFRELMKIALGESNNFVYSGLQRRDGEEIHNETKTRYRNMLSELKIRAFDLSERLLEEDEAEERDELKDRLKNVKETLSLIKSIRKEDESLNGIINTYDLMKIEKTKLEFKLKAKEGELRAMALKLKVDSAKVLMVNG